MSNRNRGLGLLRSAAWRPADRRALAMALLGGLFCLRVIGQALVTYAQVGWLPAVERWQSGLLPYWALLACQIAILSLMGAMIAGVWRGEGPFQQRRPRLGRAVRWFGFLYLASMVVRYVVTMALWPEWRWFGHSIPTAFHIVLATYLLVYSGVLIGGVPPRLAGAHAAGAPTERSAGQAHRVSTS